MHLPLNALRAFEASARHLSFTRAAQELNVSQAAISQQVRLLEDRLGKPLFRRLPRGLVLTDEGFAMLPTVTDAFDRIGQLLQQVQDGRQREVLNVAAVGTFAVGWLLPRLETFQLLHPFVDLRLFTNNNLVDLAGDGLDYAIRFGDGAWHATEAEELIAAPLTPLCNADLAEQIKVPADLTRVSLLRSYRTDEWLRWFAVAGVDAPLERGTVFDSSLTIADAAVQGLGVALLPSSMFEREISQGRLIRIFDIEVITGGYWLTWLKSKKTTHAMEEFRNWLRAEGAQGQPVL